MRFDEIRTKDDLARLVEKVGVLPMFRCEAPGWSVEENCDPSVWFTDREGPWEWKGQLAAEKRVVYSKLIRNKNAFVSLEWFPDLANYRRDGYDFEGWCEDGLAPFKDQELMAWLEAHAPVLSRTMKREHGPAKGYDTVLTRLQMQIFIINQDFVYSRDRNGRPYGWGNALLTTPERWLGMDVVDGAARRRPEESLGRITAHLHALMPDLPEETLRKLVR